MGGGVFCAVMSVGNFGLCCCNYPPSCLCTATAYAIVKMLGFQAFPDGSSVTPSAVDGVYATITTYLFDPATGSSVTGNMSLNVLNGTVASHSVTYGGPGPYPTVAYLTGLPAPDVTSADGTNQQVHDGSGNLVAEYTLSDQYTFGAANADADTLLSGASLACTGTPAATDSVLFRYDWENAGPWACSYPWAVDDGAGTAQWVAGVTADDSSLVIGPAPSVVTVTGYDPGTAGDVPDGPDAEVGANTYASFNNCVCPPYWFESKALCQLTPSIADVPFCYEDDAYWVTTDCSGGSFPGTLIDSHCYGGFSDGSGRIFIPQPPVFRGGVHAAMDTHRVFCPPGGSPPCYIGFSPTAGDCPCEADI